MPDWELKYQLAKIGHCIPVLFICCISSSYSVLFPFDCDLLPLALWICLCIWPTFTLFFCLFVFFRVFFDEKITNSVSHLQLLAWLSSFFAYMYDQFRWMQQQELLQSCWFFVLFLLCFYLRQEARVPKENPHRHMEKMQTPHCWHESGNPKKGKENRK